MRPRTALLVCCLAVLLGTLTGVALPRPAPLPGHQAVPTSTSTAKGRATPAHPASATVSPASGPVTEHNLLHVSDFRHAGVRVTPYPQNGNTMPTSALTACTAERAVGARTLSDLTGRAPAVLGTWTEPVTTATAEEVLAVAESPRRAAVYARRLVAAQTLCQDEPKGHWVYGAVHTERVPAGTSARWLAYYHDRQNVSGRAPAGGKPCGGVVIAQNGTHFAVLSLWLCTDGHQLASLARAAADRLG